jgi:hypothetical protein
MPAESLGTMLVGQWSNGWKVIDVVPIQIRTTQYRDNVTVKDCGNEAARWLTQVKLMKARGENNWRHQQRSNDSRRVLPAV